MQIPDDYNLVSFDVKSLLNSNPLQLALQFIETAIQQSTVKLLLPIEDIIEHLRYIDLLSVHATINTTSSCMEQPWGRLFRLLSQKL